MNIIKKRKNLKSVSYFILVLTVLCACVVNVGVAFAADVVPLNRYFTQTWGTQDGLPHNSINALEQTPDGYIWAGTWEGVARYNGIEFEVYTRGERTGLPDSGIRSLYYHPGSDALIVGGGRGGISLVSGQHWQALPNTTSMVNYAFKSADNALWLALEDAGIQVRFADGSHAQYLAQGSAYQITEDHAGRIWFATNQGLFVYQNHQFSRAQPNLNALSEPTFALGLNANGQLLVGTEKGIWIQRGDSFSLLHEALEKVTITSILVDDQNSVWVGTINHGLYRYSTRGLEKLDATGGLPNNRIFSLLQDLEGNIWVGTNGGMFRLRRAPFTTFTATQGLSGNYIRTVMQQADGGLLVGSSSGLDLLEHDQFMAIPTDDGRTLSVLSLMQRSSGGVLVGTYTDGVWIYENGALRPWLDRYNGLPSNEVRATLEAHDGSLWIGTAQGLIRQLPNGHLESYDESNGLQAHFTMGLAEDNFGRVWIATGLGVAYYDKGVIHQITFPKQSDAQYAFSFYVDDNGTWMATDRGVAFYENKTSSVKLVGKAQGLPVDKIFSINFDAQGQVWITSNRGIIQTTSNALTASLADPTVQLTFEWFKEEDGLMSIQMNGGSQPSQFIDDKGDLWFASAKGLATTQPHNLAKISQFPIPVSIENVLLDGEIQSRSTANEDVVVSSAVDRLSFKYAGLGFAMPTRIEYQTSLEGFDKHWVNRGQLRVTEYTNLMPGQYRFRVRARYPDGEWHEQVNPISVVVKPHFSQTSWFKIVVFSAFCCLIYLVYKARFAHLKKSEAKLKARVKQQTQSLEQQSKLFEYQATHDLLTGIANRRAFDEQLVHCFEQAKLEQQPLCLALIDIDHFKQVNDQYSHLVGDKVIAEVACQMSQIAPQDAVCARWGGEEFALLFPNRDIAQARQCVGMVREVIKSHEFHDIAPQLSISVSAGIASIHTANDYDTLLKHADQALYRAKHQGRDRVVIFE